MKKTRFNHRLAMEMKYGGNWDSPLFGKEPTAQIFPDHQVIVDDATEEKAEVYGDLNRSALLDEQRERVLSVIKHLRQCTDNQIARELKIHPSTVAARRNELRDRGLVVPVLDGDGVKVKQRDPITGIPNTLWKAI